MDLINTKRKMVSVKIASLTWKVIHHLILQIADNQSVTEDKRYQSMQSASIAQTFK